MDVAIAKRNNVTWFNGFVTRENREKLHGHRGAVLWFTGLSASGKSTIAHLVERGLHRQGCSTYVLDGDNVRHGLCSDLTFCPKDRAENIRRIGEMTRLLVDAGIIKEFTGISAPYETPEHPDLVIKSFKEGAPDAATRVIELIERRQII